MRENNRYNDRSFNYQRENSQNRNGPVEQTRPHVQHRVNYTQRDTYEYNDPRDDYNEHREPNFANDPSNNHLIENRYSREDVSTSQDLPANPIQILHMIAKQPGSEPEISVSEPPKRTEEAHQFPTRPQESSEKFVNPAPRKEFIDTNRGTNYVIQESTELSSSSDDTNTAIISVLPRRNKRRRKTETSGSPTQRKRPNVAKFSQSELDTDTEQTGTSRQRARESILKPKPVVRKSKLTRHTSQTGNNSITSVNESNKDGNTTHRSGNIYVQYTFTPGIRCHMQTAACNAIGHTDSAAAEATKSTLRPIFLKPKIPPSRRPPNRTSPPIPPEPPPSSPGDRMSTETSAAK